MGFSLLQQHGKLAAEELMRGPCSGVRRPKNRKRAVALSQTMMMLAVRNSLGEIPPSAGWMVRVRATENVSLRELSPVSSR